MRITQAQRAHTAEIIGRAKIVELGQSPQLWVFLAALGMHASDDTTPRLELAGIPDPLEAKEKIRNAFRASRQREGMRMGEYIPS